MYDQHGQGYQWGQDSQIVNQPGLTGPPYSDQEMWFAQYDQGPSGATSVVPVHMRSNPVSHMPLYRHNPTEDDFKDPIPGYKAPVKWFQQQSTGMKVAIVGSALVALGGIAFLFVKKK